MSPLEMTKVRGLVVVSDDAARIVAIDEAIAAQPDVLGTIRHGKVQAAAGRIQSVPFRYPTTGCATGYGRNNSSMRKKASKAIAVAVTFVLAVTLSACDQFVAPPLSYTVVGSTVVVRVCLPMTIESMTVETVNEGNSAADEVIWEAVGQVSLEGGTEFGIGHPPEGLAVLINERMPRLDEVFTFDMDVRTDRGTSRQTDSFFEAGDLEPGVWIDGYGSPLEAPCTHEPCQPGWSCINDWDEPEGKERDPNPTFSPRPNRSPPSRPRRDPEGEADTS